MIDKALLDELKQLMVQRIGLLIPDDASGRFADILRERTAYLRYSSLDDYLAFLVGGDAAGEWAELVRFFTSGETFFFRDQGLHELLKDRILPELLEHRKAERTLRIWCAACSSGEEAYSIAMLLNELMPDQSQWNISILGTDINRDFIEKARQGIYTEWSFRGMSDERRQLYFHQHKNTWVLNEVIRNRVTFRPGNLAADEFPDRAAGLYEMDLILCRNTFIYMAPHMVSRIADKFAETLSEGGILITGHGELYAHHLGKLRARVFPESIIYQKAAAPLFSPATTQPAKITRPVPEESPHVRKTSVAVPPQHVAAEADEKTAVSEMQQAWLYANQGQRDKAAESCGEMVAKNPLDAEPHYLLALLAQEHGDLAEARDLLKKVIYLDPSFVAAYLDLGDLYERDGDGARAGKMRAAARNLLKALPGDSQVRLYGTATVHAVLQYVEHQLSIPDQ